MTLKACAAPPSERETSLIETAGGGSLSVIVPIAAPSAISANVGCGEGDRVVLVASSSRSPLTGTLIVSVVSPGAKLSVPVVEV